MTIRLTLGPRCPPGGSGWHNPYYFISRTKGHTWTEADNDGYLGEDVYLYSSLFLHTTNKQICVKSRISQ